MVKAYKPSCLKDALEIINNKKCLLFAGGTDIMIKKKSFYSAEYNFENVLFLHSIDELKGIVSENSYIKIGSCCTLSYIVQSKLIPKTFKDVVESMASPAIRNVATIGGNICNASPAGDTLPYLYAVNAILTLESLSGKREVYIGDFIKGPKIIDIKNDEILTEVKIPVEDFDISIFKKVGTRKSTALSKVSFVGLAKKKNLKDIRIAFGAVGPTVVRSREIEEKIINMDIKDIHKIIDMYSNIITPIDDQRSTSLYRKEVSLRLLENFLLSFK
ncbi:xanthine dehydrogenase family protein subunit M [Caloramator sp. E03]|uniref:FAD binding domain-containing protein n=1 Tax=Caloramator sp. E03 TaxID=2576307 RepID=UPI0011106127|nr:FAD binding domain-containing protein [Caloramator sp. E03]QCX33632.1 xanthine dehydrogenase family protein subunit M [Caloramator sp. E03]